MIKATKDLMLPATITGSLPRPTWYTENLAARPFRDAMRGDAHREQYRAVRTPSGDQTSAPTPRRHRDRRHDAQFRHFDTEVQGGAAAS
jgi:hypothetical protein